MFKTEIKSKNMKWNLGVILIVFAAGIMGCNPNQIYNEHFETGEGFQWFKKDKKVFNVNIEDATQKYNVYLTFRYATGFAKREAPVTLSQKTPGGATTTNDYALKIRDDKGDYLGEPGGDIWDSEHQILKGISLEAGTHEFILEHNNGEGTLFPVLDVGLIVEKVEK
jgi:gliding motility-associated lipoprotein GldH